VESTDPFCAQQEMIWNYAQTIAESYPEAQRTTYIAAAEILRVPYWDWALDPKLPECMTAPMISINTPTGLQSITNPLYSYLFSPSSAKGFPAGDPVSISNSWIYGLIVALLLFFYSLSLSPFLGASY
jgi:hypothetical protein